jgi:hypothetical protein
LASFLLSTAPATTALVASAQPLPEFFDSLAGENEASANRIEIEIETQRGQ